MLGTPDRPRQLTGKEAEECFNRAREQIGFPRSAVLPASFIQLMGEVAQQTLRKFCDVNGIEYPKQAGEDDAQKVHTTH